MQTAAEVGGERVWPLPLPADYASVLQSPVADLQNIGGGRYVHSPQTGEVVEVAPLAERDDYLGATRV